MLIPLTDSMSLPTVTSLADCADWSKTVSPYLPQLYALPSQFAATIADPAALRDLYLTTNPAVFALAFSLALFPVFLVVSEINRNYSQVDRVWSILPTVYNIHYAVWARLNGLPTQRVDNVMAFSVVWSMRLTYNYWRKGGYNIGSEDYRWELIKKRIGPVAFFLLNIVFISSLQSVLLWAVTTPTYIILLASRLQSAMTLPDTLLARFMMVLVVFEYFADGQMWSYQTAKHQYLKTAKMPANTSYTRAQLERGFITSGLWRYSRHPNFAAEQLIWVVLYTWGLYSSETLYNWTGWGMVAYLGVFFGSTPLTEGISAGKYPEYKIYQQRVGKFAPNLFGKGWSEKEMETLGPKLAQEHSRKKQ
nr:uncharacterized protein CFP56_65190 [Quercus suber]